MHKIGVKGSAIFKQFALILARVITDYKCQNDMYVEGLLSDLWKSLTDSTEVVSLYIQLSRMQNLQHLSIIRNFDPDELRKARGASQGIGMGNTNGRRDERQVHLYRIE